MSERDREMAALVHDSLPVYVPEMARTAFTNAIAQARAEGYAAGKAEAAEKLARKVKLIGEIRGRWSDCQYRLAEIEQHAQQASGEFTDTDTCIDLIAARKAEREAEVQRLTARIAELERQSKEADKQYRDVLRHEFSALQRIANLEEALRNAVSLVFGADDVALAVKAQADAALAQKGGA